MIHQITMLGKTFQSYRMKIFNLIGLDLALNSSKQSTNSISPPWKCQFDDLKLSYRCLWHQINTFSNVGHIGSVDCPSWRQLCNNFNPTALMVFSTRLIETSKLDFSNKMPLRLVALSVSKLPMLEMLSLTLDDKCWFSSAVLGFGFNKHFSMTLPQCSIPLTILQNFGPILEHPAFLVLQPKAPFTLAFCKKLAGFLGLASLLPSQSRLASLNI
jgi:hypothetical protein